MSGDESSSPRDRSSPGLPPSSGKSPVVRLDKVSLRYGNTVALRALTLDFPAGCMVGLIGPDGVGKSSLFSLVSGAHAIQTGRVEVLDGDMADVRHRRAICPRVAYMPQGLGKNLYPTLSVFENTDFFGRLFGQDETERRQRIDNLLQSTGLTPFRDRPAGKLSGGMKQKLGLCCALIHDPDLLILDEPTTGVDPLSRRQFWDLIDRIRVGQPDMSVLVATAYMEEAARFDWLVAMDAGQVLATGSPQALLDQTGEPSLEQAFIALLPEEARRDHKPVVIPPRAAEEHGDVAIEAKDLTMRFGDFVAVDHVGFRIERGEIFGFLGSNGCGKTTTMKMLTGLLPPTEGEAWLFGEPVDPKDLKTRQRVGYMSQAFSLYTELTVGQNLLLHGRLFHVPEEEIPERIDTLAKRFGLEDAMDAMPDALPMGQRQRLSLAVALIHRPDLLILDEPTSGVDPVARDAFWQILAHLSRRDKVTIFISTHFMNEAERCDRISLMHAGHVLISDKPAALPGKRGAKTLEDAFISYLEDAEAKSAPAGKSPAQPARAAQLSPPAAAGDAPDTPIAPHPGETATAALPAPAPRRHHFFDVHRMFSYSHREALELLRDPVRGTMALLGSVILLFIMGYGINMDVEDVSFAVLDRDHTTTSRDYALNLGGSRYFIPHDPISDYEELDRRMRSGELSLVIEIPPQFARDLRRGAPVAVAAWVDGAMPQRGETVQGYVRGMHNLWLDDDTFYKLGQPSPKLVNIETRFRYNPDVKSLVALVPAVIPLLLILIPTMLTSLSVVREKEMGSIVNLYVTPVTRLEFLVGKQLPYIALGMVNYLLLVLLAVTVFGIPFKGSFFALTLAALLYVAATTAMGLLISTFMRSQIAAIFGSAVLTMLPAQKFSGMLDPVSSLEGGAALISDVYPMAHFLTISRGAFSKALGVTDLPHPFLALVLTAPILLALSALFLKKQES